MATECLNFGALKASISINDVLPSDVFLHIISFENLYRLKVINKEWKLLSEMSECIEMRKLYAAIDKDESVTTWIVHPHRRYLNAVEKELGFRGPLSLYRAFNNSLCNDGGRILIHDGVYKPYATVPLQFNGAEIIGLGSKVYISCSDQLACIFRTRVKKYQAGVRMNFKNVSFYCEFIEHKKDKSLFLLCGSNLNFTFEHCSFHNFHAVIFSYDGSKLGRIHLSDCTFDGVDEPILFSGHEDVLITNCRFTGLTTRAITAKGSEPVRLKCIGNEFTFDGIVQHPIQLLREGRGFDEIDLRDNVITNPKEDYAEDEQIDPNSIWQRVP